MQSSTKDLPVKLLYVPAGQSVGSPPLRQYAPRGHTSGTGLEE